MVSEPVFAEVTALVSRNSRAEEVVRKLRHVISEIEARQHNATSARDSTLAEVAQLVAERELAVTHAEKYRDDVRNECNALRQVRARLCTHGRAAPGLSVHRLLVAGSSPAGGARSEPDRADGSPR